MKQSLAPFIILIHCIFLFGGTQSCSRSKYSFSPNSYYNYNIFPRLEAKSSGGCSDGSSGGCSDDSSNTDSTTSTEEGSSDSSSESWSLPPDSGDSSSEYSPPDNQNESSGGCSDNSSSSGGCSMSNSSTTTHIGGENQQYYPNVILISVSALIVKLDLDQDNLSTTSNIKAKITIIKELDSSAIEFFVTEKTGKEYELSIFSPLLESGESYKLIVEEGAFYNSNGFSQVKVYKFNIL